MADGNPSRRVQLKHICEVCGVEEILTPKTGFEAGWDYPPKMGAFGIIGPRTCPNGREQVKFQAAQAALNMLRLMLIG